jgi:hypothetical protein
MSADLAQHLLIAGRQLLEAGPDGHTTGTGRDKRRGETPQFTHPVTPARPHPKIP